MHTVPRCKKKGVIIARQGVWNYECETTCRAYHAAILPSPPLCVSRCSDLSLHCIRLPPFKLVAQPYAAIMQKLHLSLAASSVSLGGRMSDLLIKSPNDPGKRFAET
jgi:hypothetical protein